MKKSKIISSREIGARIKKRRRELQMSQESLAEILDVSYQQVQRYESGSNKLNVENVQVIADALAVPLSYFFESFEAARVSEDGTPYVKSIENRLLRYFRKTKNTASRNLVVQVARLAARAGD